jgi:hypothetical protein
MWPEPKVRAEILGNISQMTITRWKNDGFPQPMKIRGRNYYSQQQVERDIPAWLASKNEHLATHQ